MVIMFSISAVDASIENIHYYSTDSNTDRLYNFISKVSLFDNNQSVEKTSNNEDIHHEIISEIKEAEK
jgi:hypothetical protein